MPRTEQLQIEAHVCTGDLPDHLLPAFWSSQVVAVDIETSGLDWQKERIASIQLLAPGNLVALVRITDVLPVRVIEILRSAQIYKLFHYAMFDMRFIGAHWQTIVSAPLCTKICSKILNPRNKSHSLQPLVRDYLGVHLSKSQQRSDWFAPHLTQEQVEYAVRDVLYLPQLFMELKRRLVANGSWQLAVASFEFLPARVLMDLRQTPDVFDY